MTIEEAIVLAKQTIMADLEYIDHIKRYDKEHPYTYDDKLGCRISELVINIVWNEIILLSMIILEIQPKSLEQNSKKIL